MRVFSSAWGWKFVQNIEYNRAKEEAFMLSWAIKCSSFHWKLLIPRQHKSYVTQTSPITDKWRQLQSELLREKWEVCWMEISAIELMVQLNNERGSGEQ